jgi:hypothetical protein
MWRLVGGRPLRGPELSYVDVRAESGVTALNVHNLV